MKQSSRILILQGFFSLKVFWISAFVSILALLSFYVFQVNFLNREIGFLQDCQKKLNQFSNENETLEADFSRLNSLENITQYTQNQNFEKVGKVKYIRILEGTVVTK